MMNPWILVLGIKSGLTDDNYRYIIVKFMRAPDFNKFYRRAKKHAFWIIKKGEDEKKKREEAKY